MIAIDTNILVRLFVYDETSLQQIEWVRQLVEKQDTIYVSQIVQVELVWVLETAYKLSKSEVICILQAMKHHQGLQLEKFDEFCQALQLFENATADFSDYVIFANAQTNHYPLWTFDKKLSKIPNAIKLNQQNINLHINQVNEK